MSQDECRALLVAEMRRLVDLRGANKVTLGLVGDLLELFESGTKRIPPMLMTCLMSPKHEKSAWRHGLSAWPRNGFDLSGITQAWRSATKARPPRAMQGFNRRVMSAVHMERRSSVLARKGKVWVLLLSCGHEEIRATRGDRYVDEPRWARCRKCAAGDSK